MTLNVVKIPKEVRWRQSPSSHVSPAICFTKLDRASVSFSTGAPSRHVTMVECSVNIHSCTKRPCVGIKLDQEDFSFVDLPKAILFFFVFVSPSTCLWLPLLSMSFALFWFHCSHGVALALTRTDARKHGTPGVKALFSSRSSEVLLPSDMCAIAKLCWGHLFFPPAQQWRKMRVVGVIFL